MDIYSKPSEIFALIMPVERRLSASDVYLKRLGSREAPYFCRLVEANKTWLNQWLPPIPEPFTVADARRMIAEDHRKARQGVRLDLGVYLAVDDSLVGHVALHSVEYGVLRSAGLSYWIDKKNAGRGFITQVVATLISFAFEEALLHRVWLETAVDNFPSARIAEKLGFRNEGSRKDALYQAGAWKTVNHYAMLETEYDNLAEKWIKNGWLGC